MTLRLVIANKAYSSWSQRPWMLMRHFAIPFDATTPSQVTQTTSSGVNTYDVKWLDREIRFAPQPLATCTAPAQALVLPSGAAGLPVAAGWNDPSDPANTAGYIGARETPAKTDPRVIHGVVMY